MANRNSEALLPLMEVFHTIQGEGFYHGSPAVFIRLGGCDVGCHWCDTKNSWDASQFKPVEAKQIAAAATSFGAEIAVVTGGEPLQYSLDELTAELIRAGMRTHLETSGAYPLSGQWHWICLSPKKTKPPAREIHAKTHELKMIIFNKNDFQWAEEQRQQVNSTCKLFLQPEWERREKITPLILAYIRKHPQWRISVQLHKYLKIP